MILSLKENEEMLREILHTVIFLCCQVRLADCEREKAGLHQELDTFRHNFQAEQTSWLDEKEKVIRYVVYT